MENKLQLFCFPGVFPDYSAGAAFMVAETKEQAIDLLVDLCMEQHKLWKTGGGHTWNTGAWPANWKNEEKIRKDIKTELERVQVVVQEFSVGSGGYAGGGS